MDFFDEAINRAKEAFDIACKKTNEVVNTGKQRFDIASLQNKRAKDYEALGEIYYNLIKDTELEDQAVKDLVDAINDKNNKILHIKQEINNTKDKATCPVCYAPISEKAQYCSSCGAKIEQD